MQKQRKNMGNWAELPEELLILTARRISLLEDFLSFSGVCRSWRSVATNDNFRGYEQIPWLMLSDKDKPDDRQFISLRKGGVIRTVNLPKARGKRCLETLGWLVTISEDGDINLLHPFTQVQISLPHITTFENYLAWKTSSNLSFIHKAVLSSRPEESEDYVLVVIYGCKRRLAFWSPVNNSWTALRVTVFEITFYRGQYYTIALGGTVFSFTFKVRERHHHLERPCHLNDSWSLGNGRLFIGGSGFKLPYIVQSEEALLIVIRVLRLPDFLVDDHFVVNNSGESRVYYETCGFEVFEVDLRREGEWVEKTSLGDNALFLGENSSVSVYPSRFQGIKPNCIYYTNDLNWDARHAMGIYDMETRSLRPYYAQDSSSLSCPPMWVTSSSF